MQTRYGERLGILIGLGGVGINILLPNSRVAGWVLSILGFGGAAVLYVRAYCTEQRTRDQITKGEQKGTKLITPEERLAAFKSFLSRKRKEGYGIVKRMNRQNYDVWVDTLHRGLEIAYSTEASRRLDNMFPRETVDFLDNLYTDANSLHLKNDFSPTDLEML